MRLKGIVKITFCLVWSAY